MELGNFEQLHYGGNSACRFFFDILHTSSGCNETFLQ